MDYFFRLSESAFATEQAYEIVLVAMPFFKTYVANWISLNLSVQKMRVWILFVLCLFYFLDHVVICYSIFTGDSKSCGLPPECNIHCYVLDVSMPKHTMHCTPDLVTVLPWWFIYGLLCGCVVDWLNSNLPQQCSPHDMWKCAYLFEDLLVVNGCAWLTGRQSVWTKFLRKQKEQM